MGAFLRDVMQANVTSRNFRIVGPDETASNRLQNVFEVTDRTWMASVLPEDTNLGPNGRVMEILSEHTCQGWLEGYLLTGRHGFFSCYEAFIHIVDSMFNQHAKWLDAARDIPWRQPISSLNYLLTSHVWHQEHNGFSHQDPGFIDVALNKKADVVRVYLPPDANTLLCMTDHVLRTWDRINIIVAGNRLCGSGCRWRRRGSTAGRPGDLALGVDRGVALSRTLSWRALAMCRRLKRLRQLASCGSSCPSLRIRVVNVVDLMALQPKERHPHGLADAEFDAMFTKDRPVIFSYHGYPWTIHRLTYRRTNHDNFHVRGYNEEGTTTTPFDMTVLNGLDRFSLVLSVIEQVASLDPQAAELKQLMQAKLLAHHDYIREHGQDMPEILNWKWDASADRDKGQVLINDRHDPRPECGFELKYAVFKQSDALRPALRG